MRSKSRLGKNKDGTPKKKTVYGYTEKEVNKNYRDLMLLVDRGVVIDNGGLTVSELYDEWYRIKKQGKIRANTIKTYRTMYNHVKDTIGHEKIKDVTMYHIESMVADLVNEGHIRTAKGVLQLTNAMLEYAVRNNLIPKNPCAEVSVTYAPNEKRALSDDEKDLITNNIDKLRPRQKIYLLLLRYTGMRKGEVLALSKKDIDKDKLLININKTLVQDAGLPFVQDLTKTKAGVRKIPIFVPLIKPLFDYMETLEVDDLFTTGNGNYISLSQLSGWTTQIKNNIGLGDDITNHTLRHNFISECYHANVPLKKTSKVGRSCRYFHHVKYIHSLVGYGTREVGRT